MFHGLFAHQTAFRLRIFVGTVAKDGNAQIISTRYHVAGEVASALYVAVSPDVGRKAGICVVLVKTASGIALIVLRTRLRDINPKQQVGNKGIALDRATARAQRIAVTSNAVESSGVKFQKAPKTTATYFVGHV